jgi:hypothetical protein
VVPPSELVNSVNCREPVAADAAVVSFNVCSGESTLGDNELCYTASLINDSQVKVSPLSFMDVVVDGRRLKALCDSGAQVPLINKALVDLTKVYSTDNISSSEWMAPYSIWTRMWTKVHPSSHYSARS